jgi:cobalamin biosynthesis protein CobD/CbiB
MWLVYGTMALIGVVSRVLNNGQYQRLMGTSVLSVVLWHLIVNIPGPYPPLSAEALVFDIRLLMSTLAFTTLFYTVQKLVQELTNDKLRIS